MKIAILTSSNQWFIPFAKELNVQIKNSKLFFKHEDINEVFDVLFILSYHLIIPKKFLNHKHNIVIHASDLPEGKGWAPFFWQILEGKNQITFSMFEASNEVDNGDIYMKDILQLTGYELNEELREKQATFIIKMCLKFLNQYNLYRLPKKQRGKETFYSKRSQKDSQLDINKTIKEQFNLLRIVNNIEYPGFFIINGHKYKLMIEKMEK